MNKKKNDSGRCSASMATHISCGVQVSVLLIQSSSRGASSSTRHGWAGWTLFSRSSTAKNHGRKSHGKSQAGGFHRTIGGRVVRRENIEFAVQSRVAQKVGLHIETTRKKCDLVCTANFFRGRK